MPSLAILSVAALLFVGTANALSCYSCTTQPEGGNCATQKNTAGWGERSSEARCLIAFGDNGNYPYKQLLTTEGDCTTGKDGLISTWKDAGGFETMTVQCCDNENLCNEKWSRAGGPATNNPNDAVTTATGTGDTGGSAGADSGTGKSGSLTEEIEGGAASVLASAFGILVAVVTVFRF